MGLANKRLGPIGLIQFVQLVVLLAGPYARRPHLIASATAMSGARLRALPGANVNLHDLVAVGDEALSGRAGRYRDSGPLVLVLRVVILLASFF